VVRLWRRINNDDLLATRQNTSNAFAAACDSNMPLRGNMAIVIAVLLPPSGVGQVATAAISGAETQTDVYAPLDISGAVLAR